MQKAKNNKSKPKQAAVKMTNTQAPVAIAQGMKSVWYKISEGPKKYPGSIRIRGCDLLQKVIQPSVENPGTVYSEIYINPREFQGTRLCLFSQAYEKYRFEKMKFRFVPVVASSQPGSVGMAYDPDIDDPTPAAGSQGIREFFSWPGTTVDRVWVPQVCEVKPIAPDTGFFCDTNATEDRTSYQGQLYVFCDAPTGITATGLIGDVWLEFDIVFFSPQLGGQALFAWDVQNNGSASPSGTDALLQFVTGKAGQSLVNTNAAIARISSGTGPNGITELVLNEGLYQVMATGSAVTSASTNYGPSNVGLLNLRSLDPQVSVGPAAIQPLKALQKAVTQTQAGGVSLANMLINSTKGGTALSWAPSLLGGGIGQTFLSVLKLGQTMDARDFNTLTATFV